ncbi:MAG: hypothetical protein Q9195_006524 [Heterodermia aff. obscurata]
MPKATAHKSLSVEGTTPRAGVPYSLRSIVNGARKKIQDALLVASAMTSTNHDKGPSSGVTATVTTTSADDAEQLTGAANTTTSQTAAAPPSGGKEVREYPPSKYGFHELATKKKIVEGDFLKIPLVHGRNPSLPDPDFVLVEYRGHNQANKRAFDWILKTSPPVNCTAVGPKMLMQILDRNDIHGYDSRQFPNTAEILRNGHSLGSITEIKEQIVSTRNRNKAAKINSTSIAQYTINEISKRCRRTSAPASASSKLPPGHAPSAQLPPAENMVNLLFPNPSSPTQLISTRPPGALPVFTPTSSPELDNLLSTFRSTVFLPSHLISAQRTLLYRPKNHPLLTNPDEPATVKLGNEVLPLQPLNHLRDEPATRSTFARILALMTEGRDWANLPGFLEGLVVAKRRLKSQQLEKMVRRANMCGRQGVVLVCLQRVERTGVGLWDGEVVRECMRGAVMRAQEGGWAQEAVEGGWKLARAYWELMWMKTHTKAGGANGRMMPDVMGVMVLMSAARVVKAKESTEERMAELETFVQRLLGLWGTVDFGDEASSWHEANRKLLNWAPVLRGMQLAQKVLGKDSKLGSELGAKAHNDLEPMVLKALATVYAHKAEEGSRRGISLHEDLAQADL